jgi:purine nucleosidase
MTKRIVLDTDPGIDDALAILLAIASPELQLDGIVTVHGNCTTKQTTINALALLELAGASQVPVARGFDLPLVQPSLLALETHGDSGLGYAKLPSPRIKPQVQHGSDFLIEQIMSNPGEITLVAVGPLTNVAVAIRKEPRMIRALKEIIIMGGSIRHQGNSTPLAEFNVHVDPHAAHIVFHSGIPMTLVPLDVTYQCILTPKDVKRLNKINSMTSISISMDAPSTTRWHWHWLLCPNFVPMKSITWMWIFQAAFRWAIPLPIFTSIIKSPPT